MSKPLRVLMVEDDEDDALLLLRELRRGGYAPDFERVETAEALREALDRRAWDVVVSDFNLPRFSAPAALALLQERGIDLPFLIVSGTVGEDAAVVALKAGAHDFVTKGKLARLIPAIEREVREAEIRVERRRAEEALRESQRALSTLLSNLPGMVYRSQNDPDWTMEFVSEGCLALTGYSSGEILGESAVPFSKQIYPEDRGAVWAEVQSAVRDKRPFRLEYRLRTKRGEEKWVWEQGQGIFSPEGELLALEGFITDITERKRAEEALHQAEEQYRLLFEDNPHPMWVYDPETLAFLAANHTAVLQYGYSREEFLAMKILDLHPPEDLPALLEGLSRVGHLDRVDIGKHRKKDGTIIDVEITGRSLIFAGRRARIALGQDITERTRAAEALKESEARFRSVVESLGEGLLVTDLDDRVLYANARIEEVFGYTPDELVGRIAYEVLHPGEGAERFRSALERRMQNVSDTYEMQVRRKDGKRIWIRVIGTPLRDAAGTIVGTVGAIADITERRQLEEQLRQSQKMDAIGRLAGGVAHDFNNMLMAIKSNAHFLLMDLPEDDPLREDAREIDQAADRAASLTRQLLAFSRQQVLQPQVLDLNAVVSQTEKMLRRLIGADVELVTELGPGLGPVEADPGQMEQVLLNLAVNARDAMPGGGRIVIRTANAEIDGQAARFYPHLEPGTPAVVLSVSDTGTGIDRETRERIFDPFFTTKEQGKGTGLGLSTVYGIVKQSGGYIWLESEVGRGSTFSIHLPRVQAEPAPAGPDRAPAARPRSATVLLVEDEEGVRRVARKMLERSGFTVIEASDGEEALRLCAGREEVIDLVVTDVVMPGMGGGELVERLAALRPGIRVLFMSGYTDEAVEKHGTLVPGAFYIQKPFAPEILVSKVVEMLNGGPGK
ncbi:MAG: PAS domain S-box protein [Gemmatimonadota bacterium]|nr:PAS domain S-box protein [Gemmatimonadota bacterium]